MDNDFQSTSDWMIVKKKFYIPSILFLIVGILLSIYATNHHLILKVKGETQAICNINDFMSCDNVAASSYSEFFNIPLGVWGLGYFISLFFLIIFYHLRASKRKEILFVYKIISSLGLATSVVLASISFFILNSLCLTCLGTYIVNIAIVLLWFLARKNLESNSQKNYHKVISISILPLLIMIFTLTLFKSGFLFSSKGVGNEVLISEDEKLLDDNQFEIPIAVSPYVGKGEDYRKGNDDAPVVLVEFADFECPACRVASELLRDLKEEFGDQLLVVFKNYPLDMSCNENITRVFHKNACLIAQLSRCAGRYGRFWEYHDLAFNNQKQASKEKAVAWAKQLGLDDKQINDCLNDKGLLEKIKDDIQIGKEGGITGTPSFFINGRRFVGKSRQLIRDEIQKILSSRS